MFGDVSRFEELRSRAEALLREGLEVPGAGAAEALEVLEQMRLLYAELEVQRRDLIEAQEAVEAQRRHFSQLFGEAPVGFARLGATQRFEEVNEALRGLLGMSAAAPDGPFVQYVASQSVGAWLAAAGAATSGSPQLVELFLRRVGGEQVRAQATVSWWPHGEGGALLVALTDVTALRRAEAQRAEQVARFERLFEQVSDGVVLVDLYTDIIRQTNASFCSLLERGWQSLEQREHSALFPEALRDSQRELLEREARRGGGGTIILEYVRGDGARIEAEASVGALEEGGATLAILLLRDVTARRQQAREEAEGAAQRMQGQKLEAIGQLASGVAHNLNNILAIVLACVEQLPAQEPVDDIRQATLRGRELAAELMMIARQEVTRRDRVELGELVREVARLVKYTRVAVTVEAEAGCVLVGDAGQWHQALLNLALNARDAMPQGGSLAMRVWREGGQVMLEVADTGRGMSEEVAQRAFEPFFTTKAEGTGLGLAHVYSVARAHHAKVSLITAPGAGCAVRFEIPAAPELVSDAPREITVSDTRMVALVVDDEPLLLRSMQRLLGMFGLEVLVASSGESALSMLEAGAAHVEVMITDYAMPGLGGAKLLAAVAARYPWLRLIAMTGMIEPGLRDVLIAAGAHVVLTKPFTSEELGAALASVGVAAP
jgi:two-component system cell cycle sensor histidine kinase/response regulator CckA